MAAHTAEETLTAAQGWNDRSHEVSPTHPGEDIQWWITDEEHNTFAVGTWVSDTEISFRDYKP